ncbi:hypothetical protein lbkm_0046 [Lachnospiraceae bacterium KM106-2]|nr:hypothetical protein lbkm_0046 [Lachnospiraceae bacterium KM106-2]
MKYEWRKQEKELYIPKREPELIQVPSYNFLLISGNGDPNEEEYSQKVEALYALAYGIRMLPKQGEIPDGYYEYTVYPLEGVWNLTEEGKRSDQLEKEELLYTIMIRQPEFVTEDVVKVAFESVKKKKSLKFLNDITFGTMEDGLCVQMLHIGSYDKEPESFRNMDAFCERNGLEVIRERHHREIYLSDPRKVEPSKCKTVLRYFVRK